MISDFRKLNKIPPSYVIDGKEIDGDEIAVRMLQKRSWKIDLAYDEYQTNPVYSEMRRLISADEECEASVGQHEGEEIELKQMRDEENTKS